MKVYKIDRTDKISWAQDYSMIVVAQDALHAEKCARMSSEDFIKAPLKVEEIDLTKERCIMKENTGA